MRSDLTTDSTNRQDATKDKTSITVFPWRFWRLGGLSFIGTVKLLGAMTLGALLLALVYQIPVTHDVNIGGYDAAYVQGFYDPERSDAPALAGSDGSARWTHDISYVLFPQAGLPAQVTLRLRGKPDAPASEVSVWLNGARELGRFRPGAEWEQHTFAIDGGLLKPSDVVIEIRSPAAPLSADDPRPVGVLLDRATYSTGAPPITPYPTQLAYGALAAGMLYILTRNREPRIASSPLSILYPLPSIIGSSFALSLFILCSLFFVLYRAQPPYPYPLRGLLPALDAALAALLALRYGPAAARRVPALLDGLALGGIGVWMVAVLVAARSHVILSIPGVENDFGVFVRRSAQLFGTFQPSGVYPTEVDGVLRADGFYNLGYPLLLWLARPLTADNPFLAARLIAALSGVLLLGATWWLARRLLGRGPALIALLMLAFSPFIVEYGLYVGTDMPFAALCALALVLLVAPATERAGYIVPRRPTTVRSLSVIRRSSVVAFAGLAAGAAFLMRHPGLLLLPFGWLAIWRSDQLRATSHELNNANSKLVRRGLLVFTLAFLIAISPQLIVNTLDTGQPLYNQQAKNVWLCVYGSCDWGHWDEAPNSVTMGEIVLRAPDRVLANWWANVRGFFGTGAEDTSEFGRAIQLRFLSFPANWLAIGGVLAWLVLSFQRIKQGDKETKRQAELDSVSPSPPLLASLSLLLVWIGIYVLTVSIGISLPRFFLPLAPIYTIAAAWTIARLEPATDDRPTHQVSRFTFQVPRNVQLIAAILLLLFLWSGFATGAGYVLGNQAPDEAAAARLVQATLRPGERLIVQVSPRISIGKYSAIAHLVTSAGGQYLLAQGGTQPAGSTVVQAVGQYTLYRLTP
jgi:4-amino-4-deoxy-L-arabinose transferase-like glycosyltransferase